MAEAATATGGFGAARPPMRVEFETSGMLDSAAGAAAAVLGIIGLAGILSSLLAAIATIVVGFALMALGTDVLSRYLTLVRSATGTTAARVEDGGGVAIGVVGGAAGAILGILALLGVARLHLVAIAIIAIGATLILGSTVGRRLDRIEAALGGAAEMDPVLRLADSATAAAQMLVGIAGVTLGILALVLAPAVTLELVALLAFGVTVLISTPSAVTRGLEMLHVWR
jgi:hypothetical protein